ncbi:MAG TPA: LCP family protein [Candidatus Egerieenecus merdigallinarum]|nr:LCP family protein [Candidatus Egerieenecus merdigallinarum]
MIKRIVCLVLTLILSLSCCAALADDPQPIETIPYEELPPAIDGQHHYLLLCVDQWTGKPHNLGNTDGIVIVTLDTRAHRVMLTSIIRDALVERPDGVIGRINYIAKNYGPEALCKVISQHVGVKIEKYLLFDFSQIASIVDFLGGVDIEITSTESNYLQRYAIPKDSTTPRLRGAGTYHFNGHSAVIYMRIRKVGGGGDFMRTQRVRTVLSTLADQCREITLEEARALVDSVLENTTLTNMSTDEMVEAMNYAMELRGCTVEELRLPPDGAATPITYAGMSVQEIDWVACRQAMDEYLQNSFLVLDDEE